MKLIVKYSLLITSFLMCAPGQTEESNKTNEKIAVKCHVELIGGVDTIHFRIIPKNKLSTLAKDISGEKIMTGISTKEKVIYKVIECVADTDEFTLQNSRVIDEKTAR